jgi:type IV secretion system protein VirD4
MRKHPILIGHKGGEYLWLERDEHVALYAKSGSGKTSSFTIPNCLTWPSSLVVLDIKGDAFHATAGYRSVILGQDVYCFAPGADDARTHRWSPLEAIDRTSPRRFYQIQKLAYIMFPELPNSGSSTSAFWEPSARDAFIWVLCLMAETQGMPMTMAGVLRLFSGDDSYEILIRLIADARENDRPYSQDVITGISDYLGGPSETVYGIRKSVSTRLASWRNPEIKIATNSGDFNLRDIRRRPVTIYLTVSPSALPSMRPLISMFFEQLISLNTDKTPEQDPSVQHQTLVILDEYARLGKMQVTAESAQYARQYGLRLAYIAQDKAQLRAIYGPDTVRDIFENLGAEIAYASTDIELTEELEKRIGANTVDSTTINKPRLLGWAKPDKQTESTAPHKRPLMLAQEIARLPPEQQLVLRPGMSPMICDRVQWWQDPMLKDRVMPVPHVPQHELSIALDDGMTEIVAPQRKGGGGISRRDIEALIDGDT